MKFQDLDVVMTLVDFPDHGIAQGECGAIVYIHNQGEAYEVEFVDQIGRTRAMFPVLPCQIAKWGEVKL